jgi:WD40 repeat protein
MGGGSFSPDGQWIVTGGGNATTKLWKIGAADVEEKYDFGSTQSFSVGASFSADSQWLAVGTARSSDIRIFRMRDGGVDASPERTLRRNISEAQSGGLPPPITSVTFHPTDPDVLLATYQDGAISLWNTPTQKEKLLRIERGIAFQGALSPAGNWAATSHDDGVVRLWPLKAAQPAPQLLRGHQGPVFALAYSPDGSKIASGSSDGTARIWLQQPALGRSSAKIAGVPDALRGKAQVSLQSDRLIVTYKNNPYAFKAPRNFGEPAAAAVSPSGRDAVVVPQNGRPYLFSLGSDEYIVRLPGRPAAWKQVGFVHQPNPGADHASDRIVGVTQDGEAYSWPYFAGLAALRHFAGNNLPFVKGNERLPIGSARSFADDASED